MALTCSKIVSRPPAEYAKHKDSMEDVGETVGIKEMLGDPGTNKII